MSKIEDIVGVLEDRINKVLHNYTIVKQTNSKLKQALGQQQDILLQQQKEIAVWEEKYKMLKIASSMLGSDENKRETKLKINTLIREIDHCISQLSE